MDTIRRISAACGLVAVAVIAVQLVREDIDLTDAAWRASAVLGLAITFTLVGPLVVRVFAASLDDDLA